MAKSLSSSIVEMEGDLRELLLGRLRWTDPIRGELRPEEVSFREAPGTRRGWEAPKGSRESESPWLPSSGGEAP